MDTAAAKVMNSKYLNADVSKCSQEIEPTKHN